MIRGSKIRAFIDEEASTTLLWVSAIVTFVMSKAIQTQWLDKSYAESGYPVPFYVGQTTFDATETKAHYQVMIENGTLDIFWQTQIIDFVYIAATFCCTFLAMAAIYRMLAFNPGLQKFSWTMVLLMPWNAGLDVLENAVSFVMLRNPTDFANWLIVPYSGFAVAKFAIYAIGYLWIVTALLMKLSHVVRVKRA